MRFEHFAINVPEPASQAEWYVEHLGFQLAHKRDDPPFMHFLADDTGRIVVELYHNPAAEVPDYTSSHPLTFHVAVIAADATAERLRLERAGATLFSEDVLPDGSVLVMMRDPWGVPLQLCQRTTPLAVPNSF